MTFTICQKVFSKVVADIVAKYTLYIIPPGKTHLTIVIWNFENFAKKISF